MSTALLTGGDQTIDVQTAIGQSGDQSVILAGADFGDKAGFSIADAGDVKRLHRQRRAGQRSADR